jgi:hypothetical protein
VKDPYVGETRGPDHWLEEEAAKLSFQPMLDDLQAAGTTIEVLPYEPVDSLVSRVLMAAGAMEEELPQQIPWTNTSMSEPVLMALLAVNRSISDPLQRIEHRSRLFEELQPAFVPSSPELFLNASLKSIEPSTINPSRLGDQTSA